MRRLCELFDSSIGKKILVATAGLLLCGFLVVHLSGNLLLFAGEERFNSYAEGLDKIPLLPAAEIGLALLFLLHIIVSLKVRYENRRARPIAYTEQKSKEGRTWGSRTMLVSGILLLAFLIIHVKNFRFTEAPNGLFLHVMGSFKNPLYSLFYVLAMAGLGLHLSHGFQSAFQTLGLNDPRYSPLIKKLGMGFAAIMALGFAVLPLWAYFLGNTR